jgi:hypothetical protein
MKPTDTPPTRGKWFTAGVLTMVADITGTLAQFMPMKAVFILAADDIPSFFPAILVNAGPILTGLALVLAAALLGVISTFAKKLALTRSAVDEPYPTPQVSSGTSETGKRNSAPVTVKEFSAFVLIAFLFAGSAAVSLTFTLTIAAWVAGSAVVLAIKIHRGARKPPYPNGRVEFVSGFKKWMTDSALWAAVGAAIFTLVVDFPPLGLTGILLGAVLLRRMQQVVPDVVPLLITKFARQQDGNTLLSVSALTQAPYDFLATPVGNRLLTNSLHDLELNTDNWQVVGIPDNVQITLLTKCFTSGENVLLRIFASGQERSLEHEYALRTKLTDPTPFHHTSAIQAFIAGLPAIVLTYPAEFTPNPDVAVTGDIALKWQIQWERQCVETVSLQNELADHVVADPKKSLLPLLVTAQGISGSHQEGVRQVIRNIDLLKEIFLTGPRCIHFGGPVRDVNLLRLGNEEMEPLDVRRWGVGLTGEHWSDSVKFPKYFRDLNSPEHVEANISEVAVRFRTQALARALRARNLRGVILHADELVKLLSSDSHA